MIHKLIIRLKEFLRNTPKHIWVLLLIMVFGIFLRTYNFHDWLRFSMDQSRDALMLSEILESEKEWPLLGPLAGGTIFYLGPAYYYFSLIAGNIFGNYPDKLAYPSLFFSILTIPLLYIFLREYFSQKNTLFLTALMSVSHFAVANSRFSSNPNLTSFFILLFLYCSLKLLSAPKGRNLLMSGLVGLSLGVGVQLHTTLLVIMPFMVLAVLAWLTIRSKSFPVRTFFIIMIISSAVNAPQIISEFRTKGANTTQFFLALFQARKEDVFVRNALMISTCQIKANANIVGSFAVKENCSKGIDFDIKNGSKEIYGSIKNRALRKSAYALNLFLILIFSISGYVLLFLRLRREKNEIRRNFLKLAIIYNIVSLFFLIPIAPSMYVHYFIILFFIPFILLGLIFEFLETRLKRGQLFIWILAAILTFSSLIALRNAAIHHTDGSDNNLENSNLKWAEDFDTFFAVNDDFGKTVYLTGENKYLDRYGGPMTYMLDRRGKTISEVKASEIEKLIPVGSKFIYIKNEEKHGSKEMIKDYKAIHSIAVSPVQIYILMKQ